MTTATAVLAVIIGASLAVLAVAAFTRAGTTLDALVHLDDALRRERTRLPDGARVYHDDHGVGTVIDPDEHRPGMVLVAFDDGSVGEVHHVDVEPITPADEQLLRELRDLGDAIAASRGVADAAPPLTTRHTCHTHDVERCTDRPCCSTCPTREDTR